MKVYTGRTGGGHIFTVAVLMVAAFTVAVGYGVVLPRLPNLIERLLEAGAEAGQVSRHTGLLTAAYTVSLFLFSPLWGRLADQRGPRGVLFLGLLGFGITLLVFSLAESLVALYAERFLSGMFAAAVTPVVAAVAGSLATTEQERARQLALVSMASMAGFILGPMLGVFIARFADFITFTMKAESIAIPLTATALFAFSVASAVLFAIPGGENRDRSHKIKGAALDKTAWLVLKLLILTFIVSAGVGAFEVGLALRGKQDLGLSPNQIALIFAECGLIMLVMQAIVFSPRFKPDMTRRLITPALAVLAAALFLVPRAADFTSMLVVIGAVAASAGVLTPILTYWISVKAGSAQGWQLGKQTAAAGLGISFGSAMGGLLYEFAGLPGASFILAAGLTVAGFLLSLGLPHLLASQPRKP